MFINEGDLQKLNVASRCKCFKFMDIEDKRNGRRHSG